MSDAGRLLPPASPCIQVCELDALGICRGCRRSWDEIGAWTRMSAAQQWAVLERCAERGRQAIAMDSEPGQ